MGTSSVNLTTSEEEEIEELTLQNPGSTAHLVHLAHLLDGSFGRVQCLQLLHDLLCLVHEVHLISNIPTFVPWT